MAENGQLKVYWLTMDNNGWLPLRRHFKKRIHVKDGIFAMDVDGTTFAVPGKRLFGGINVMVYDYLPRRECHNILDSSIEPTQTADSKVNLTEFSSSLSLPKTRKIITDSNAYSSISVNQFADLVVMFIIAFCWFIRRR